MGATSQQEKLNGFQCNANNPPSLLTDCDDTHTTGEAPQVKLAPKQNILCQLLPWARINITCHAELKTNANYMLTAVPLPSVWAFEN